MKLLKTVAISILMNEKKNTTSFSWKKKKNILKGKKKLKKKMVKNIIWHYLANLCIIKRLIIFDLKMRIIFFNILKSENILITSVIDESSVSAIVDNEKWKRRFIFHKCHRNIFHVIHTKIISKLNFEQNLKDKEVKIFIRRRRKKRLAFYFFH